MIDVKLPQWLKDRHRKGTHDWRLYEIRSRLLTTIFKPKWFGKYDPAMYQCDHKFSILEGYKRGIPLEVINSRANLELTTKAYNQRKHTGCSISLPELLAEYQPDEKLNHMVAYVCRTDNEDLLLHWSLLAHNYNKSRLAPIESN